MPPQSRSKPTTAAQKRKSRDESESEDDVQGLASDNLDDDADVTRRGKGVGETLKKKASTSKPKKRRKRATREEDGLELKEGQEIVGKVVRAPKTGQGESRTFHRRRIDPDDVLQFLLDRSRRTRSTFWTNSKNRNATIGNGWFLSLV